MTDLAEARRLDDADPLAHFRSRFTWPDGVIYLDGNSLGALPVATPGRVEKVIREEWGIGLIRSWNDADWISMPQRVGSKIAPLIGAEPDEVIAADSVSVNLFKLIAAALAMQPGRTVVLSEPGNFPTDLYMIQGLEGQGLADQKTAAADDLEAALGDDVALLLLTHVHYKSGRMHEMARLTKAAHDVGALVLWDLSHSVGAVEVDLNGCDADFAVGCGYKYLNGGPGAPAFAYVAKRHHDALQQPLSGWMGHAAPFAFSDDYTPAPGVDRLLAGTPHILGLAALEVGVDIAAEIGTAALAEKSRRMSEFFRAVVTEKLPDLELVSPTDPAVRGSQLSFRHEHAYPICQALIARGIIGDFREPDILRFGFAPSYLSFEDVFKAATALAELIERGEWQRPEFSERSKVT
ncbi:kynureninase [Altererythrobacter sp. ZODW24]|uniref:kynureninase n=1 Tax=Altererythrobacter sp. ZODW24 TaxID=2185142 RepID=UPI000DF7BC17|nr:kynureninase [Altererythrobacter sp. ZODW24]